MGLDRIELKNAFMLEFVYRKRIMTGLTRIEVNHVGY